MENNSKIDIGKRIDYIRNQKNMSKDKFAELIGISGQHLGKVIGGESGLSVEKIIELSIKTGYPTDYILLGKELSIDDNLKNILINIKSLNEEFNKNLDTLDFLLQNL